MLPVAFGANGQPPIPPTLASIEQKKSPVQITRTELKALGIGVAEISDKSRERYDIPNDIRGLVVVDVDEDADAATKGLKRGDVIDEIQQASVATPAEAQSLIDAAKKAGSGVENKVTFKQGDVLKMTEKDFDGVDVVTLYLLPEVNRKLKPVLQKGLKPGARVVSHDFDMGDDWKPEKTVMVTDDQGVEHTVYLWTIAEKK